MFNLHIKERNIIKTRHAVSIIRTTSKQDIKYCLTTIANIISYFQEGKAIEIQKHPINLNRDGYNINILGVQKSSEL